MELLEAKIQEPQFNNLPDWQVADILNSPDSTLPSVYCAVLKEDILSILMTNNIWTTIKIKAAQDLEILENKLCGLVYDVLTIGGAQITLTNQKVLTSFLDTLDGLLQSSIINQDVYNEIITKATKHPSWAEVFNVEVTPRTVGLARGGIA